MKPYLLENDDIQHEHRLLLEAWYAKRHGRRVPFKEILHNFMKMEAAIISKEELTIAEKLLALESRQKRVIEHGRL